MNFIQRLSIEVRLPQVGTILHQRVLEKRNQPLLVITIQFVPRLFKTMKSCVFCQQKHMQ